MELLLEAGQQLPAREVELDVVRRMAGCELFLDFEHSDTVARGTLLGGQFELLRRLEARHMGLQLLADAVVGYVGATAAECGAVQALASNPARIMELSKVGACGCAPAFASS